MTLELVNPTGGAVLGSRATALVTIADNALVQFQQATFTVAENAGKAVITVVRTGAAGIAFSVPYSATAFTAVDKVDFHTVSGTLTFGAGVPSRTFTVPILNDTALDGNRSVRVTLGAPTNGVQLGSLATASLVIQDDDTPGAFKLDAGKYTVLESARVLPVKVLRTGPNLAGNVTVFFRTVAGTAVDGVNYTGVATPLTFGSGQTSKLVNIPILRDFVVAPSPRTLSVELSAPGSGATLAAPSTAPVTITEVDLGARSSSPRRNIPCRRAAPASPSRWYAPAAPPAACRWTSSPTTAPRSAATRAISPCGPAPSRSPAEAPRPPSRFPSARTRWPRASRASPSSYAIHGVAPRSVPPAPGRVATVTIVDDEPFVQFSGRFMGNSPEVVRTGQMGSRVTVNYEAISETATSGVDFMPMAGTLTFGPNVRSQLIPLVIVRDIIAEGSETFTIRLSDPQPVGDCGSAPPRPRRSRSSMTSSAAPTSASRLPPTPVTKARRSR